MTPSSDPIRIGTRASALARWQAEHVAAALASTPGAPAPELVLIKTEGDRIQDVPLSKVQGKAFFTKEIEEALLENRVDVAVHSLKDLATAMPSGLALGAVMERADPRDALLLSPGLSSAAPSLDGTEPSLDRTDPSPDDLPRGARVGTSSLRRRALLKKWRPDLELADLRGNVPTRIRKLDDGDYDAIVLAVAGIHRLGLEDRISAYLPVGTFLPAVSQGAVAVQTRAGDSRVGPWVAALDHEDTRVTTGAERAFLRRLEGGCQIPVGAFGQLSEGSLHLRGIVASLDGGRSVQGDIYGTPGEAERLGTELAEDLLVRGARAILGEIRGEPEPREGGAR